MTRFALRFCVSARRFDARGFLFGKQVTALARDRARSFAGPLAEAHGGYVFVAGGRVWNAPTRAAFDPRHVYWDADSFAYAALMIEDIAVRIDDPREPQICALAEMINLEIARAAPGKLALTGRRYDGNVLYPTMTVSSRVFVRELLAATAELLRVAEAEVRRRRARTARQDRALLERFRQAAARIDKAGPSAL